MDIRFSFFKSRRALIVQLPTLSADGLGTENLKPGRI